MALRHIEMTGSAAAGIDPAGLAARFDAVRAELEIPQEFPPAALAEAEAAVSKSDGLPERDETSLPFFTIDPVGSMDLDQAMFLERDGDGYRVRYAIADVPAFVEPGGPLDDETRKRGQTFYLPDTRTPLHPTILSEGAASLLPGETRPAFLWDIRLDADGERTSEEVYRAMVRSRERRDYDTVQAQADAGEADEQILLLKEIGEKRIALELERGGSGLPMPEQEVDVTEDGTYRLRFRPPVPSEDWNAQISLLTGIAAAEMMLHAGVGILRTMPEPDHGAVQRFRREARALGAEWPAEQGYGDFLRGLDRTDPVHLAIIHEATILFRGAGYTPFEGAPPEDPQHAAVASVYAHVTAPLRRLVDRFGLVVCEAISRGAEVPEWVRAALPTLPDAMADSDRRANTAERQCANAVEAAALRHRIGDTFKGTVVELRDEGAVVQVDDPAVVADATGHAELGDVVQLRLAEAEVSTGTVRFEINGN